MRTKRGGVTFSRYPAFLAADARQLAADHPNKQTEGKIRLKKLKPFYFDAKLFII